MHGGPAAEGGPAQNAGGVTAENRARAWLSPDPTRKEPLVNPLCARGGEGSRRPGQAPGGAGGVGGVTEVQWESSSLEVCPRAGRTLQVESLLSLFGGRREAGSSAAQAASEEHRHRGWSCPRPPEGQERLREPGSWEANKTCVLILKWGKHISLSPWVSSGGS